MTKIALNYQVMNPTTFHAHISYIKTLIENIQKEKL
jgi:hypothetical protein